MNILTIPLRNTRKRWVKTLLLLCVFSLGVTSIISLHYVSNVVGHSLEEKLTAYGANILISPHRESLSISYGGFSMGDMSLGTDPLYEGDVQTRIKSIPLKDRISVIAPKLVSMAEVSGVATGIVGVRWQAEQQLKGFWGVKGEYPVDDTAGVIAGSKAAEKLSIDVGDKVDILGKSVLVTGVLYPTGGDDDSVLFAGLDLAQELFNLPGQISFVEVAALCAGCPIEDIVKELKTALPHTDIQALQSIVKQRMYSINFVKELALIVSVVILLTACSMIGMTMLSSVNERKKEIGLLRSLGFSRQGIFSIFCFEAMFIGLGAGVVGYLAGLFLSREVLTMLDIAENAVIHFSGADMFVATLFIVLVSVLSALFPAWKGSNIEPSAALISL
ncbi:MAG: ABC transporter permease [Desulfovibrio sp.]